MQSIRCFIAVNLPEEIKDEIEKEKQTIIASFPEGTGLLAFKWVKKDNLHITTLFLGDTKTEDMPKVIEKLKQAVVGAGEFTITINKISFGLEQGGIPRLVWLELAENEQLKELSEKISENLNMFCNVPKKNFLGHITLGRVKPWQFKTINPEEVPEINKEINLTFAVKAVDIMESSLKRTGPEYNILQRINL